MRISSGCLRGQKIRVPSSASIKNTKPTEGIVKEAIISMLRPHLQGMVFLDLFAGFGAVGLEAYSNGAKKIVFVEKDRRLVESLRQTITQWGVTGQILVGDYRRHLDYFHRNEMTFDVVYIDPPYHVYSYSQIIKEMNISVLMRSEGWVLVERHYRNVSLSTDELEANYLTPYRSRKYGSVCLDVYRANKLINQLS